MRYVLFIELMLALHIADERYGIMTETEPAVAPITRMGPEINDLQQAVLLVDQALHDWEDGQDH